MLRNYCLCVIVCLFSVACSGQSDRIEIAGFVGITFSNFYDSKSPFAIYDYKTESISNETYGLQLKCKLGRNIWIASGISQARLGTKVNFESFRERGKNIQEYDTFNLSIDTKYLIIPLTIEYRSNTKLSWSIKLGGYVGLLRSFTSNAYTSSIQVIDGHVNLHNGGYSSWVDKDYTNNPDYGLTAGAAIAYPIANRLKALIEANINVGLRQLDAKFNNDRIASLGDPSKDLKYDYFDLSSESKNIFYGLNIGLAYRLW